MGTSSRLPACLHFVPDRQLATWVILHRFCLNLIYFVIGDKWVEIDNRQNPCIFDIGIALFKKKKKKKKKKIFRLTFLLWWNFADLVNIKFTCGFFITRLHWNVPVNSVYCFVFDCTFVESLQWVYFPPFVFKERHLFFSFPFTFLWTEFTRKSGLLFKEEKDVFQE